MTGRVLIVDDALFMRTMLKDIFLEAGWQVEAEADNGGQAVEEFRRLKPDLITMDIVMPEMGGIDALRRILKDDPQARVIVCSALGQKHLIMDAIQAGAKDFIVKPFRKQQVIDVVERVMAG